MKKSTVLLIAAAVMLSSCGTAAQMTSSDDGQRFADGIYSHLPEYCEDCGQGGAGERPPL